MSLTNEPKGHDKGQLSEAELREAYDAQGDIGESLRRSIDQVNRGETKRIVVGSPEDDIIGPFLREMWRALDAYQQGEAELVFRAGRQYVRFRDSSEFQLPRGAIKVELPKKPAWITNAAARGEAGNDSGDLKS